PEGRRSGRGRDQTLIQEGETRMYLAADISVDICAATSCKLCTQYCPEANTILYDDESGKAKGLKYGSAYVAVVRCKACAACVWVCDNMAKHHAIKMVM